MATRETTSVTTDESELFDLIAKEIKKTFDQLIDQLTERRDALLKEIEDNKEKNITRESTRKAALEELITTQQHLEGLSLRVNVNREFHNQNKELYRQRIEQLSVPTKLHPPFFSCQTLYQLQTLVAEFGEVRECVMEYSLKKQPVIAVGKRGKGNNELDDSAGVALDASNQLIYVADCANRRIQVVSMSEEFLKRFGQETFKRPYGVAVTGDSVFVTDIGLHALFQFGKSDYQLMRRTDSKGAEGGQLNNPRGLCVDFNGDVCVADSWNNRFSVFSRELRFGKCIGTGKLSTPVDVKVTHSGLVVLDKGLEGIHFFSRSGDLLNSCTTQWDTAWFFCLDTAGNILVSDRISDDIKLLSPTGQLIDTLGVRGYGKGQIYCPMGVCVSETGTIIVISNNINFALQAF